MPSKHSMPNAFVNESRGKYRILHATKWSKGGRGEVRTRLVVIAFSKIIGYGDYALRMQNYDGATYGGSAYNTAREAHTAFLRRYLQHNESYREGNVSHYPGIVK